MVGCEPGGAVVAFVSGGKERTGQLACDGEIYAIYLRQEAQRRGLGGLLVRRFVHELDARGFGSMAVWVLALNPSRGFYEYLGGKVIGQRQIEQEGEPFSEVAYGWRNLTVFL
jgi:GNAT superfamily N-acetyltransferase